MKSEFLSEADEELREAARYYEKEAAGLGLAFLSAVHGAVHEIETNPEAWAIVRQSIRKKTLFRFLYNLLYSTNSDVILIIAVAHHKRRPNYWRARLKK